MNTEKDLPQQPATEAAPRREPDYGYGHPAHRPDPDATYSFEPGPPRTLPPRPDRRWKVSG